MPFLLLTIGYFVFVLFLVDTALGILPSLVAVRVVESQLALLVARRALGLAREVLVRKRPVGLPGNVPAKLVIQMLGAGKANNKNKNTILKIQVTSKFEMGTPFLFFFVSVQAPLRDLTVGC